MAMLPVALVQARAVPLDVGRGIERATEAAAAAIAKGARLVGFGETLLGGYPIWLDEAPGAALWDHPGTQALHRILLEQAVVEGDPRFAAMQALADDNDAVICIGAHQRVRSSLYNSQWIFRKDARPLVRRKLVPTHGERLVWMRGDGSTLGVHRAGFGKVSTLMCWEHWMPLARAAMHAQGSAVHVAAWPTVRDAYLIASQHYAFEGRAFVLAAGTVMHRQDLMDGLAGVGGHDEAKALFDTITDGPLQHGASAIIAPDTS
ncbi:MAG: nitrilase-related carbon-nitrogen hydrolase, partial [Pseudomonadota bacterium]